AGGGSVVTLPILIEVVGLSANVANGTNRVAIVLQNIVAVATFQRGRAIPWATVLRVTPWLIVGALAGSLTAAQVPADAMKKVFAFVIVLVALSALLRPKRWLGGHEDRLKSPWRELAFTGIGIYGGFVQAGVGFLLLAGLVLGGGLDLVRGNAAKVAVVLIYTILALGVFLLHGQVELLAGLVLGIGNATGAFISARLAIKRGAGWIRWVLLVAALGAAAKMLLS
ncbi:MAG: sulfite exporter TauE/SafE family protein, partial [Planctomycetota bacterium]